MPSIRAPRRTNDEWFQIITECRRSGLSDAQWCNQHGINRSTMCKAIRRLRAMACQIPESSGGRITALDLTAPREPVEIHVVNQPDPIPGTPAIQEISAPYTDNSHMIEITIGAATIKVRNGSDPALLKAAVAAAGGINYAG